MQARKLLGLSSLEATGCVFPIFTFAVHQQKHLLVNRQVLLRLFQT